jgi:hypothetical protein
MINAAMRSYDYFTIGEKDKYGQQIVPHETPTGTVKIAIYTTSQSIQDNIRYKDATYVGLTLASGINDKCIIQYGDEKLKVLYVQPKGRFKQVFLKNI